MMIDTASWSFAWCIDVSLIWTHLGLVFLSLLHVCNEALGPKAVPRVLQRDECLERT